MQFSSHVQIISKYHQGAISNKYEQLKNRIEFTDFSRESLNFRVDYASLISPSCT